MSLYDAAILEYLRAHPGASTPEVARYIWDSPSRVSCAYARLDSLASRGMVHSQKIRRRGPPGFRLVWFAEGSE